MKTKAGELPGQIHTLARSYHWEESTILNLSHARRQRYLTLIDLDRDAAVFAELESN